MKPKTFVIAVCSCALAVLAACAALVAWVDPLLTARTLKEGDTALFVNERYELAGLIRRQEYESVILGTSSVANFRASWFTEGTGKKTLKITFPDGRFSEFDTALDLAFRTHGALDTVYFCLDPTVLIREEQVSELPEYLYNDDPLDDVEFYLNGESLSLAAKVIFERAGDKVTLDEAYVWDGFFEFSKKKVLEGYHRPEDLGYQLPEDTFLPAARRNVDVVCRWIEEHPDTRFVIWFPPYSILFWDKALREGKADAMLKAVEYASLRLMDYGNAAVHCFLHNYDCVTDLNFYTDHIHCSYAATYWQSQMLIDGLWRLDHENWPMRLYELRDFIKSYDYEALLAS